MAKVILLSQLKRPSAWHLNEISVELQQVSCNTNPCPWKLTYSKHTVKRKMISIHAMQKLQQLSKAFNSCMSHSTDEIQKSLFLLSEWQRKPVHICVTCIEESTDGRNGVKELGVTKVHGTVEAFLTLPYNTMFVCIVLFLKLMYEGIMLERRENITQRK